MDFELRNQMEKFDACFHLLFGFFVQCVFYDVILELDLPGKANELGPVKRRSRLLESLYLPLGFLLSGLFRFWDLSAHLLYVL